MIDSGNLPYFVGCGRGGPKRYRISGMITYHGKPVPTGEVSFEPESEGVGGGFASILDGKFDTAISGRGHLGGKHRVQIVAFDGLINPKNPLSPAKPMFQPYQATFELPAKTSQLDFQLPMQ